MIWMYSGTVEVDSRFRHHDHEQRDHRRPLPPRIDDLEGQKRRLSRSRGPVRPREERKNNRCSDDDHDRRWRHPNHIERGRRTCEQHAPVANVVEAEADEDDADGREDDTQGVDLDLWFRFSGLEFEAEEEDGGGVHDEQAKREAPVDCRNETDNDECEHARDCTSRAEQTHSLYLLLSAVMTSNERHKRRHQGGASESSQALGRDHDRRARCHSLASQASIPKGCGRSQFSHTTSRVARSYIAPTILI